MTEEIKTEEAKETKEPETELTKQEETAEQEDEDKKEVEPWLQVESDSEEEDDDDSAIDKAKMMPVGKHTRIKHKLRSEIETLKSEMEALKVVKTTSTNETRQIKIPRETDFDTDLEYSTAMDNYIADHAKKHVERFSNFQKEHQQAQQAKEQMAKAVDDHYERAATLVQKTGMEPKIFRGADKTVREGVEAIFPNAGDQITNGLIATLGQGSEKVITYLGRNPTALAKFQSFLLTDSSGLKAAVWLGEQKAKLTNTITNHKSFAPAPAPKTQGSTNVKGQSPKALKKAYDAAHKKNDIQTSFSILREARKAGHDTSNW